MNLRNWRNCILLNLGQDEKREWGMSSQQNARKNENGTMQRKPRERGQCSKLDLWIAVLSAAERSYRMRTQHKTFDLVIWRSLIELFIFELVEKGELVYEGSLMIWKCGGLWQISFYMFKMNMRKEGEVNLLNQANIFVLP